MGYGGKLRLQYCESLYQAAVEYKQLIGYNRVLHEVYSMQNPIFILRISDKYCLSGQNLVCYKIELKNCNIL